MDQNKNSYIKDAMSVVDSHTFGDNLGNASDEMKAAYNEVVIDELEDGTYIVSLFNGSQTAKKGDILVLFANGFCCVIDDKFFY